MRLAFTFPGDEDPTDAQVTVVEGRRLVTREYLAHCSFHSLTPDVQQTITEWTEARGPA